MGRKLVRLSQEEFKRRFQAAATGDPVPAHDFFARLPFVAYYEAKDFLNAFNSAVNSLSDLKCLDFQAYESIHKGYIFYFTAISAFFLHDFIAAAFFFDAATAEDMKNEPGARTPALLFMILESQNPNQAAREQTALA
jgi:hypothetical protein